MMHHYHDIITWFTYNIVHIVGMLFVYSLMEDFVEDDSLQVSSALLVLI